MIDPEHEQRAGLRPVGEALKRLEPPRSRAAPLPGGRAVEEVADEDEYALAAEHFQRRLLVGRFFLRALAHPLREVPVERLDEVRQRVRPAQRLADLHATMVTRHD